MYSKLAKREFILNTWDIWKEDLEGEPIWILVISHLQPVDNWPQYRFTGRTKEECVNYAVEEMDEAVRSWAYNPTGNQLGRWLAIEKGWKI